MSNKIIPLPLAAIRSKRLRDDIDGLITRKREIESEIKPQLDELDQISSDLTALFLKHDLEKVRMPDGTSISKSVTTTSRIVPEKLLEHKVSMSVIEACTVSSTSKPYVRVYYPRDNKDKS
jgi:hypothetical protein